LASAICRAALIPAPTFSFGEGLSNVLLVSISHRRLARSCVDARAGKGIFTSQRPRHKIRCFVRWWAEQRPRELVDPAFRCACVLQSRAKGSDFLGIGLSVHMHGLFLLDETSGHSCPARSGATSQARPGRLHQPYRSPAAKVLEFITANPVVRGCQRSPRRLGVRDNEPPKGQYAPSGRSFAEGLSWSDFATGEFAKEFPRFLRHSLFDVVIGSWSFDMADALQSGSRILPASMKSSEISGKFMPARRSRVPRASHDG